MADRAAWERGLVEKRWQKRVAHTRQLCEEAKQTANAPALWLLAEKIIASLDGIEPPDMAVVSRADLDLVMNHAGDPATMADYPAAAQRIQGAIERGRRG